MIEVDLCEKIKNQNNDIRKCYCSHCGKGEPLSEWKVLDYDVDRWHGITEIYIWRECPHCKQSMSF